MKKVCKKLLLVIIAVALFISFTACVRNLDKNNAQMMANLLSQKYGIEFEVSSIGNWLSSDKANTVTAYCYPKNNEQIIFEAVMNTEHELVSDDYPIRLLEVTAKGKIERKFSRNGIAATVEVSIARLPDDGKLLGMELSNLITEYPEMSLTFTTVICDGADTLKTYNTVIDLLEGFYSGNPKMSLGTTIWKYSNDAYAKCSDEMNSIPNVSTTTLEQYKPVSKVNVAIIEGTINTDYDTFKSKF